MLYHRWDQVRIVADPRDVTATLTHMRDEPWDCWARLNVPSLMLRVHARYSLRMLMMMLRDRSPPPPKRQ
jgi:hypothetical protein